MEHRLQVFSRQYEGMLSWTSVCTPWRDPVQVHGTTRAKVDKTFREQVRAQLKTMSPAERSEFTPAASSYLLDVRLELSLRGDDGKRDVRGLFPFVVEYRRFAAKQFGWFYFHPHRPSDRVMVAPGAQAPEILRRALNRLWAGLSDEEIAALRTRGKQRLENLAFDAPVRSLAEHVEALERVLRGDHGDRPKQRPVRPPLIELPKVGVDLSHRVSLAVDDAQMARPDLDRRIRALFTGAMAFGARQGPSETPWRVPPTTRSFAVVGPAGAGLTSAIERATALLLEHDGYAVNRNLDHVSRVFRLSARTVLAGMSHLGEWEKRMLTIVEECRAHRAILCFDDLMLLGSVGRSRESDRAFADVLEGPIARGEVAIWGETTPSGMMRLADEAPRLAALLSRLTLSPTETEETAALLFHRARGIEREAAIVAHDDEGSGQGASAGKPARLEIDPLVLPQLIEQARALFVGVADPQKSMLVLNRLAARLSTELADGKAEAPTSPSQLVLEVLGERTGMPLSLLDGRALEPRSLAARFESEIVGQPEASRAAVDLALRLKTRLCDPKRPRAVYLLTGPTGTGKTETAKWIAKHLYGSAERLVRFDMAEYAVPGSAARLLGGGGPLDAGLATRVREQPFSVVLLDEIEKAHPSVLYLLLQLFDEGRLTDPSGVTAEFGSATILMTSNLGARPEARAGFATDEHAAREVMLDVSRAVRDFFPPELFHRIDRIVAFRPLDVAMARAIVRRELALLLARRGLTERRIAVSATDSVVSLALGEAFDARRGARGVKSWLEQRLGTLLADGIAQEGRAEQRSLVVYVNRVGVPELAVHAEKMTEAAVEAFDVLTLPPTEDVEALRAMLEDLAGSLLSVERMERLRHARRATSAEDRATIYALEQAILELGVLSERHQSLLQPPEERVREEYEDEVERGVRVQRGRTSSRHDHLPQLHITRGGLARGDVGPKALREHLSSVLSMRRALDELEAPGAHAVDLLIATSGEHAGATSFVFSLAAAIGRWVGEIDEAHGRERDGETQALPGLATDARSPDRALRSIVMRITGLGARARARSEVGTYVVLSDDGAPELITVRMLPSDPARRLDRVFTELDDAQRRFRDALEAGTEMPVPPLPLLPRLRTLRLEHRLSDAIDVVLEDHRLGDVVRAQVRHPRWVLEPVHARLRMALPLSILGGDDEVGDDEVGDDEVGDDEVAT